METAAKRKKRRTNIEARVICGGIEFQEMFGINESRQAEWRSMGLPYYQDGRCYIYYPDEVDKFIKDNFRISIPELRLK